MPAEDPGAGAGRGRPNTARGPAAGPGQIADHGRNANRASRTRPPRTAPSERVAPLAQPWRESSLSDAQLLAAAVERKEWAWPEIVQRYTGLVLSVTVSFRLWGEDAAEIRQEVWARLYENMDRIRQPERLAGWIHAVARNECRRLQTQRNREIPSLYDADLVIDDYDPIDGPIFAGERHAALHSALDGLPDHGRILLETLLAGPDLTYEEVAAKLGMPVGSIGPTRQRCMKKLRATPALAGFHC